MFAQKMKTALCIALISMLSLNAEAQIADTIRAAFSKPPRLFGSFNNRSSVVNGADAKIAGLQGGLIYGDRVKVSMTYSWMPVPVTQSKVRFPHTSFADTIIHRQSMNFMSAGLEYVWFRSAKWKFASPLNVGLGTTNLSKYNTFNELQNKEVKLVVPIELGVSATYYFTDWLTANAGLGQRMAITTLSESQLSGSYYKLGVGVLFGVIYRKIWPKEG